MKPILLNPIKVQKDLSSKQIFIFTPQEFVRTFEIDPLKAKYFLTRYTKLGLLEQLKKGLYMLRTDPPSTEEIANALYKPSYISLEYALAKYHIIPEIVYTITSVTTKPTRLFEVNNIAFEYLTIKKNAFTGYVLQKKADIRMRHVLIAEPEKALVDYLYFVSLGKKTINDRMNLKGLDEETLISYAKLYERKRLMKIISRLLAKPERS